MSFCRIPWAGGLLAFSLLFAWGIVRTFVAMKHVGVRVRSMPPRASAKLDPR
ncbi:MAG: hypothetical protein HC813_03530 [Planctomycetes bacterium]|nr:hypothetical protein [Planctomycetota bacterium]